MQYAKDPKLNSFIKAYVSAMMWAEDIEGYELDQTTVDILKTDCYNFFTKNFETLNYLTENSLHSFELSGHDFYLTRNGHGVGFWDRGLGDIGEELSAASVAEGQSTPYIGDDQKIYLE